MLDTYGGSSNHMLYYVNIVLTCALKYRTIERKKKAKGYFALNNCLL